MQTVIFQNFNDFLVPYRLHTLGILRHTRRKKPLHFIDKPFGKHLLHACSDAFIEDLALPVDAECLIRIARRLRIRLSGLFSPRQLKNFQRADDAPFSALSLSHAASRE